MLRLLSSALLLLLLLLLPLHAQQGLPSELEGVGIVEHLGAQVDLDLTFIAENGYPVPLRSYFHQGRPVLLNLVYYSCPMLCNLLLNEQTRALREIPWTPGEEYEIVTISIDPRETFNLAQKKREVYLGSYGRPAPGWHFLADHQGHSRQLADQIGFHYRYDAAQDQYAHAAAVMILSPDGKISRYLYGIAFRNRDLRLALTEASASRVSLSVNHLLLFCFHYDPRERAYVFFARNIMRAGGVAIVLVLGGFLIGFWRKERRSQA